MAAFPINKIPSTIEIFVPISMPSGINHIILTAISAPPIISREYKRVIYAVVTSFI